MDVLEELDRILGGRKGADPHTSYVAGLYSAGLNRILEKVGEEAIEVILAAKELENGAGGEELVNEVADLWFHTLVMLQHLNLDHESVLRVLRARLGTSGLEEKRSRS